MILKIEKQYKKSKPGFRAKGIISDKELYLIITKESIPQGT